MSRIRLAPIALFNVTSGVELSATCPMTADARSDGVAAHDLQGAFHVLRRDERGKTPFARHVQRIEAEHLAGGMDVFAHRHGFFLDGDFDSGGFGDFVERAGQAAARQIAQTVDFNSGSEQFQNQFMQPARSRFQSGFQMPDPRARP